LPNPIKVGLNIVQSSQTTTRLFRIRTNYRLNFWIAAQNDRTSSIGENLDIYDIYFFYFLTLA